MSTAAPLELLLLVPGAGRVAHGWQRDRLVAGLSAAAEGVRISRVEGSGSPPQAIRLKVTKGTDERLIDVVETYWNDLMPSLANLDARTKFARGTSLVIYWAFSGIWKGFLGRKYLTAGMVLSGVALVAWYYGTFALFVEALRNSDDAPAVLRDSATTVGQVMDLVAGWEVWVFATAAMGLIPVNLLVEIMDFSKRFLSNERVGESGLGLRVAVRNRVLEQVRAALAAHPYQNLIVVGHSFGCLVALDFLADLPLPANLHLRFVTVGSSIELLSHKDKWPLAEMEKCASRPELQAWVDVIGDRDWFASGTPLPKQYKKFEIERVPPRGTFVDALTSRTHGMYFDAEATVRAVLGTGMTGVTIT
jgi:hypothetical protein